MATFLALAGCGACMLVPRKVVAVNTAVFGGVFSTSIVHPAATGVKKSHYESTSTFSAEEGDQEIARTGVKGDEQMTALASR